MSSMKKKILAANKGVVSEDRLKNQIITYLVRSENLAVENSDERRLSTLKMLIHCRTKGNYWTQEYIMQKFK